MSIKMKSAHWFKQRSDQMIKTSTPVSISQANQTSGRERGVGVCVGGGRGWHIHTHHTHKKNKIPNENKTGKRTRSKSEKEGNTLNGGQNKAQRDISSIKSADSSSRTSGHKLQTFQQKLTNSSHTEYLKFYIHLFHNCQLFSKTTNRNEQQQPAETKQKGAKFNNLMTDISWHCDQ